MCAGAEEDDDAFPHWWWMVGCRWKHAKKISSLGCVERTFEILKSPAAAFVSFGGSRLRSKWRLFCLSLQAYEQKRADACKPDLAFEWATDCSAPLERFLDPAESFWKRSLKIQAQPSMPGSSTEAGFPSTVQDSDERSPLLVVSPVDGLL